MTNQNSEVDVNVLIKLYNQRLASLTNQNILLEAKLQTLTQDYSTLEEQYNELLISNQTEE
jgi:predicted nuclease with TOPRIM domain